MLYFISPPTGGFALLTVGFRNECCVFLFARRLPAGKQGTPVWYASDEEQSRGHCLLQRLSAARRLHLGCSLLRPSEGQQAYTTKIPPYPMAHTGKVE